MSSVQSAPLMSSTALQKGRERARELFRRMDGVRSAWPAQLSSHSIRRNGGKSGTRHDSLTDRLAGEMDSKLVIEAKQEGRLARGFKGPRPESHYISELAAQYRHRALRARGCESK